MCASPHMITWMPEIGVWERSHAMTQAAPRRNVNGEAAIRPMRSGIKCSWRPTLLAASRSSGSGRLATGLVSAWLSRGVPCAQSFTDVPPLLPGIVGVPQIKFARSIARCPQPFNAVFPARRSSCRYCAHELGRSGFCWNRFRRNRFGTWTHRSTFLSPTGHWGVLHREASAD